MATSSSTMRSILSSASPRVIPSSTRTLASSSTSRPSPEQLGLYPRSRYTKEQVSNATGRPAPSAPTSSSRKQPNAPHLPGGKLTTPALRTLVDFHHLSGTFLTPSTLDETIEAAFRDTTTVPVSKNLDLGDSDQLVRYVAHSRLTHGGGLEPSEQAHRRGTTDPLARHSKSTDKSLDQTYDSVTNPRAKIPWRSPGSILHQAAAARQRLDAVQQGTLSNPGTFTVRGMTRGEQKSPEEENRLMEREVRIREAMYGVKRVGNEVLPGLEAVEEHARRDGGR
jgi:hypothetical protein